MILTVLIYTLMCTSADYLARMSTEASHDREQNHHL